MLETVTRRSEATEKSAPLSLHSLATRRRLALEMMARHGVERLVCCGNGHHMIDLDNPVAHLTGYRSVGPALVVMESNGDRHLIASPGAEADIVARLDVSSAVATDDLVSTVRAKLSERKSAGIVGLEQMPRRLAQGLEDAFNIAPLALDDDFAVATAAKTVDEIDAARTATAIAELGYKQLLEIVKPGMRECDLAIEVNLFMRSLGANDSFLMLNCGPRQDAVMPSSERPIEVGDLLLCELSPSVKGQFTQICRTVSIGAAPTVTHEKYPLLVAAMNDGIAHVKPGARLGDVCRAIDDNLSAQGYAKFSRPPFIRRRGHGLGCGSTAPGDVSVDNDTILTPGMLFMVHPNQFLPETGYMMCGEPVLVTDTGYDVLTRERATLATAAL